MNIEQSDSDSSSGDSSVTEWINDLQHGDVRAAQAILDRYMSQLIRVASRRLRQSRRRVSDEEDVVSMAFASFLSQVDQGGFSRLHDREDLWQILFTLTDRRAIDLIRYESAARRGDDQLFDESILESIDDLNRTAGIASVVDPNPSPEYAAILTEEFQMRLSMLDAEQQQIAIDKMHGLTNQEIADQRGLKLRTVERRLQEIRDAWKRP